MKHEPTTNKVFVWITRLGKHHNKLMTVLSCTSKTPIAHAFVRKSASWEELLRREYANRGVRRHSLCRIEHPYHTRQSVLFCYGGRTIIKLAQDAPALTRATRSENLEHNRCVCVRDLGDNDASCCLRESCVDCHLGCVLTNLTLQGTVCIRLSDSRMRCRLSGLYPVQDMLPEKQ